MAKSSIMSKSVNRILVPIDFEEPSLNALEHSFELARLFEAELILLYVIEVMGVFGKLRSPEDYVNKIIVEARNRFDELETLAQSVSTKSMIKVTTLIDKGKPYEKIIQTARDNDVLLIIMGKSSTTETKPHKFIGTNTMNVVRDAHCPVITVKGTILPVKFSNILVPLDFTGQTKKQVQRAIDFGGYFGSSISIISVVTKENKVTRLLKQVQMNQVRKAIQKNGIQCHSEMLYAENKTVAEKVIEYGKQINADLIIIMTQQKQNIINFYVGSTAQQIILNANIPVLSIFPAAEFKPGIVTSMVDPMGLMRKKSDE
jgi:nucleotide-binding universal stress UspA family protein